MIAINKHSAKLKTWSIEMPNAPYLNRYGQLDEETEMTKATDLFGFKRKVRNMFQRMNAQKRSELPKQRPKIIF